MWHRIEALQGRKSRKSVIEHQQMVCRTPKPRHTKVFVARLWKNTGRVTGGQKVTSTLSSLYATITPVFRA